MRERAWYNDLYNDHFAKELYPVVESYLIEGKIFDQSFVNKLVQLLENILPVTLDSKDFCFVRCSCWLMGKT